MKKSRKLTRFKVSYSVDGVTKNIEYVRPVFPRDVAAADALNQQYAAAWAEYSAACELGLAKNVKVETVEEFA